MGSPVIWDDEVQRGPLTPPAGESAPPAPNPIAQLSQFLTTPVRKAFEAAGALDVSAGIKTPEQAQSRAGTYSKLVVPQTGTDWALALGGPALRAGTAAAKMGPLAQRMATGAGITALGAGASQLETGQALPGAIQGATGALASTVPAVGGWAVRATPWGRRRVLESMEKEVLDAMGQASGAFKGVTPGTAYAQTTVFPKTLQKKFSEAFSTGLAQAEQQAPGPVVVSAHLQDIWNRLPKRSPMEQQIRTSLTPVEDKFTVTQAQELLQIARAGAYRGTRLMTEKATRGAAEQTYQAARDEVYKSLPKEASATLEQTRILHGVNLGLAAIFKEGKVLKPGLGGPSFDPNAGLQFMESRGEALRRRLGDDVFGVLHAALSREGKLGERHDFGTKELVPGILERSIVITRSILKHIGMTPLTMGGRRPQPFTSPGLEVGAQVLGGQAIGPQTR